MSRNSLSEWPRDKRRRASVTWKIELCCVTLEHECWKRISGIFVSLAREQGKLYSVALAMFITAGVRAQDDSHRLRVWWRVALCVVASDIRQHRLYCNLQVPRAHLRPERHSCHGITPD